jgi:hypothetical protein
MFSSTFSTKILFAEHIQGHLVDLGVTASALCEKRGDAGDASRRELSLAQQLSCQVRVCLRREYLEKMSVSATNPLTTPRV